ncbi:hypothetical protein LXA43DRAFT_1056309 [Ganoderma leucocontextum]|nr:hypothetical protein LXA43DRAFT_1056309 [Ganoderma leucocontextum]
MATGRRTRRFIARFMSNTGRCGYHIRLGTPGTCGLVYCFRENGVIECGSRNPTAPPPIITAEQTDLSRVPWLWVPKGIDVNHPTGHPALSQGGYYQGPQTEDTLPLSLPASPTPDLNHAYASKRLRNRRGTPHPHPGQLPPVDVGQDYGLSPDYTYSSFGTPKSPMSLPVTPPPVIPSSSSSYHPSDDYPSSSPHPRSHQYPSGSSYPGLPPRNNPLPPPPEHHPLAQSLLRSANRPTASEATAEPNHRQRAVRGGHRDRRDDRMY